MEFIRPEIKDYPGKHVQLKIDNPELDFAEAKDIAKQKAKEICDDPCCCPGIRVKPANRIRT